MNEPLVSPDIWQNLCCPISGEKLVRDGSALIAPQSGHRYNIIGGVPCLLSSGLPVTHSGYAGILSENASQGTALTAEEVKEFLQGMLVQCVGTCFATPC